MGRTSKIEKLGLHKQLLQFLKDTDYNMQETAKRLSDYAKEPVSNMAVTRYVQKMENEHSVDIVPKEGETSRALAEAKKAWLEEKDNIITAYQVTIQKALVALKNATSDEQILAAVPVALKSLDRALNHYGFGIKGPSVQINQQFNFETTINELAQIILEETENGGEIYRQRIIDRIGRLGKPTPTAD